VPIKPIVKKFVVLVGLIALLAGAVYLVKVYTNYQVNARTARFNVDVENLFAGLQKYKEHVGTYPVGGNAQVVKALLGSNPKNVIILVSRKNELNPKGELVDPWGTALQIYFSDLGVLVRSAGPNRRFDDSTSIECDDFFRSN
jgi:hypothetical protein